MKRKLLIIILLFFVAKVKAQNIPTDLFLFLGQSNMSGASPIGILDTETLENVYLFNSDEEWEKAKNTSTEGTNRYSTVKSPTNTLSPAYTFTRKIAAYTNKQIGIVSNARSATTISWWQKGYTGNNDYDLYEQAVLRAKAALAVTPGAKIKGILWLQGEGDNGVADAAAYMGRLQQLVNDLRTDLGDNTIPFIAGEIGKWNGRGARVNPVIRTIKANISNSDWVTSDGLDSKDLPNNDAHYDNLSQRVYGGRFADKALQLIYNYRLQGVTLFSADNYGGRSVLLGEGDYSSTQLDGMGVLISEIASLKTHAGYEIQFLSGSGSALSVIATDTDVFANVAAASVRVVKKLDRFSSWQNAGSNFLYDFSGARETGASTVRLGSDIGSSGYVNTSTSAVPGWLPAPSSGAAYMRIGFGTEALPQNGKYELNLSADPRSLKVRIPAGGVTGASVAGIVNASEIARFSTMVNFGSVANVDDQAIVRLAIGNQGTGTTFTTGSNLNTSVDENLFAAIVFTYNAATGKVNLSVRRKNSNNSSYNYTEVKTSYFELDTDYEVEIIGNNSKVTQKYNYGANTNLELASRTYHLYINGSIIDLSGNSDFPGAALAAGGGVPELAVDKAINAVRVWYLSGQVTNNIEKPSTTISNIRFDYSESTLPVMLTSFTAAKQGGNAVKLNWITASEQNNSHFDVLRSSDGKNFSKITEVSGAGNSNATHYYSYTDYQPLFGVSYYRLKQLDIDGTVTESEVQAVTLDFEKNEFTIYQDGDVLVTSVYSDINKAATVRISDMSGKVMIEEQVNLRPGYIKFNINGNYLKPGVYMANIIAGKKFKTVKFVYNQ